MMANSSQNLVGEIAALLSEVIFDELDVRHGNMELIPVAEKIVSQLRAQFYNEAIGDVRKVLDSRFLDIQVELEILEK